MDIFHLSYQAPHQTTTCEVADYSQLLTLPSPLASTLQVLLNCFHHSLSLGCSSSTHPPLKCQCFKEVLCYQLSIILTVVSPWLITSILLISFAPYILVSLTANTQHGPVLQALNYCISQVPQDMSKTELLTLPYKTDIFLTFTNTVDDTSNYQVPNVINLEVIPFLCHSL